MTGPCLCGDTHCSSCGPAQGNWKCPVCGTWADDGCDHTPEEMAAAESEEMRREAMDIEDFLDEQTKTTAAKFLMGKMGLC